MELAQQQRLLARLYTNSALRQRFFAEPQAVLRELGIDTASDATLAAVSRSEIQFFARSLQRKRLGDVAKLLPRTRRLLEGRFEPLFLEYADQPVPPGPPQGRADALAFASFVQRSARAEPLLSPGASRICRWFLPLLPPREERAGERKAVSSAMHSLSPTLSPSDSPRLRASAAGGAREKPPADQGPTNNFGMHGLSPWALHLIRYEKARLRAIDTRFLVRLFRYPVRALHRLPLEGSALPPLRPRPTFACWFRLTRTGRLCQISLALPWWGGSEKPLTPPPRLA